MQYIWIALGGALGAVCRFGIQQWIPTKNYPWSTFLINILGSFIIGCLAAKGLESNFWNKEGKWLGMIGFCGGFTTFSSFALENLQLLKQGNTSLALIYILTSCVLCIIFAFFGYTLVQKMA